MSPEITNLKEDVKEIKSDLKANTEVTRKGFETINGRIKVLELAEAERKGRESMVKGNSIDWEGIIKLALKALAGAIVLATGLVALLQTLVN